MKMLCHRLTGSDFYISPRNNGSIFINSVFMATLHKNMENNKNLLRFVKKNKKDNSGEKKRPTEQKTEPRNTPM